VIYFTADTHFYHKMILKFEPQRGNDLDKMNLMLIENWNNTVGQDDDIYILGDLSFGNSTQQYDLLSQLNGNKYLIEGNHDSFNRKIKDMFVWVKDYHRLKIGDDRIILFHYPIYSWDDKKAGTMHFHGHCHDHSHSTFYHPLKLNVGACLWDYKPVSYDTLKETIQKQINGQPFNKKEPK